MFDVRRRNVTRTSRYDVAAIVAADQLAERRGCCTRWPGLLVSTATTLPVVD